MTRLAAAIALSILGTMGGCAPAGDHGMIMTPSSDLAAHYGKLADKAAEEEGRNIGQQTGLTSEAKPPQFTTHGTKTAGEQVAEIHRYCLSTAMKSCPGATIRCEAFRPAFVRSCLLKANIPPTYISALTN